MKNAIVKLIPIGETKIEGVTDVRELGPGKDGRIEFVFDNKNERGSATFLKSSVSHWIVKEKKDKPDDESGAPVAPAPSPDKTGGASEPIDHSVGLTLSAEVSAEDDAEVEFGSHYWRKLKCESIRRNLQKSVEQPTVWLVEKHGLTTFEAFKIFAEIQAPSTVTSHKLQEIAVSASSANVVAKLKQVGIDVSDNGLTVTGDVNLGRIVVTGGLVGRGYREVPSIISREQTLPIARLGRIVARQEKPAPKELSH